MARNTNPNSGALHWHAACRETQSASMATGLAALYGSSTPIRLTPRELQVLSLLAEGLPNKLICRRLGISPGTVKIHVSRVLAALGVSSRLEAVILAQRLGVLRLHDCMTALPQHDRPDRLTRKPEASTDGSAIQVG